MKTLTETRPKSTEENRLAADKLNDLARRRKTDPRYKNIFPVEGPQTAALGNKIVRF